MTSRPARWRAPPICSSCSLPPALDLVAGFTPLGAPVASPRQAPAPHDVTGLVFGLGERCEPTSACVAAALTRSTSALETPSPPPPIRHRHHRAEHVAVDVRRHLDRGMSKSSLHDLERQFELSIDATVHAPRGIEVAQRVPAVLGVEDRPAGLPSSLSTGTVTPATISVGERT